MTNREFYNAICSQPTLPAELHEFAADALSKMDKRNATRSSKPSKTAVANEPIKETIRAYLVEHPGAIASDMAVALEFSTSKISSLCHQMVESGKVSVSEVKVKGGRKVKAYTLAE